LGVNATHEFAGESLKLQEIRFGWFKIGLSPDLVRCDASPPYELREALCQVAVFPVINETAVRQEGWAGTGFAKTSAFKDEGVPGGKHWFGIRWRGDVAAQY
jgi:hypothetical protein